MKKKLVTMLVVSALAAAVFAGCGKSGDDAGDASAASTEEAAAVEEAAVVEEAAEAATEEAAAEEAAVLAGTSDAAEYAAEEGDKEAITEEFAEAVDDSGEETDAVEASAEEGEDLIVDPGTQYEVRFGGNVYATPDQVDSNVVDYVYPGYVLNIDERLEDYWYAITYWIDGYARTGYIKIQ